jgi:peptidoglycan/LPS O-acetylase OafA/YrhL
LAITVLGTPSKKNGVMKEGRELFLDFLKGAAIIGVVAIHAGSLVPVGQITYDLPRFAVPAFIFASGYLLARRYADKLDIRKYFENAFFRVALIYILFTVALHFFAYGFSFSLPNLALDLLLGRMNGGNLYFIPVIIQFYLLFPLFRKYEKIILSPLALCALLVFSMAVDSISGQLNVTSWNQNPVSIAFCGRYLLYFVFGMFVARYGFDALPARQTALLAVAFAIAPVVLSLQGGSDGFINYLYPLAALFAIRLAYLLWGRALPLARNAIEEMGKNSYMIYLIHTIVLFGILSHLSTGLQPSLNFLLLLSISLAASYYAGIAFMKLYNPLIAKFRAPA